MVLSLIVPALAWHGEGHVQSTTLAIDAIKDKLPDFFGQGKQIVAHCSVDPDIFKFRTDSKVLYRSEYPDHFCDMEYLQGDHLPETREAFASLCHQKGHSPAQVGTLAYAIIDWTYRLAIAFAEYRQWPHNQAVQAKILVYAGNLAHYSEDACMPLHATVHWDGRMREDGKSPRSGIHNKVDALLGKLSAQQIPTIDPNTLGPFKGDLLKHVEQALLNSQSRVDRIYALEDQLPDQGAPLPENGPVLSLTQQHMTLSATFTARLYLTAWERSQRIQIPSWHKRQDRLDEIPQENKGGQ